MIFRIFILLSYAASLLMGQETDPTRANRLAEVSRLYRSADNAAAGEDFLTARSHLAEILRIAGKDLDPRAISDVKVKLAKAEMGLGNLDAALRLLENLPKEGLPVHLIMRSQILRARVLGAQNAIFAAYEILKELALHIDTFEWPPEDRAFLFAIKERLNSWFEDKLSKAERLFEGGAHEEASELYGVLLDGIEKERFPLVGESDASVAFKIRYRFVQSLFLLGRYQEVTTTLDEARCKRASVVVPSLYPNMLYLLGVSERKRGNFPRASQSFQRFLEIKGEKEQKRKDEVRWELGLCLYKQHLLDPAKKTLQKISPDSPTPHFYHMAILYLARIQLEQGDPHTALTQLHRLQNLLPKDSKLRFELNYVFGDAFFRQGDYKKAIDAFSRSIPEKNTLYCPWYQDALMGTGWSYLRLAENGSFSPKQQQTHFKNAEEQFILASAVEQNDGATLALASTYLARGNHLKDLSAYTLVENLLGGETALQSLDARVQGELIRAEASGSFDRRQALYVRVTSEAYMSSVYYPKAWFFRAVNEFEEGRYRQLKKDRVVALELLNQSIESFQKTFQLAKTGAPAMAGKALTYQMRCYFQMGDPDSYRLALALCDTLIHKHPEIFKACEEPDEALFLKASIALRLTDEGEDARYQRLAETTLKELIAKYPEGYFADSALNLLGTMLFHQNRYEEAEKVYVHLAKNYSHSPHAGNAWFWAGECADWRHEPGVQIRTYRRACFENYPDSSHAAESYFNYYSYAEYLQGDAAAIEHLRDMAKRYPKSPLLTVAHYLSGLDLKRNRVDANGALLLGRDLVSAEEAFEKARDVFDFAFENGLIDPESLEYYVNVRYRALLEKAGVFMLIAEEGQGAKRHIYLEYAERAFRKLVKDFEDPGHPLTPYVTRGNNYPRLLQECEYGLSTAYVKAGKDGEADKVLCRMLDKYSKAEVSRGYFLSRIWYERGRIRARRQNHEEALQYFQKAEAAAMGRVLSIDEMLDLWIQQAKSHIAQDQLDTAMRMLSKVINEDAASELRVKAMYLRAEVYSLQGRHDLAARQLETTSQKGGSWAGKAKEKLEKDYGYQ